MHIIGHIGNIFSLLTDNVCDGIIVWARGGFTCIGTDWKIFQKKISDRDDKLTRIGSPWKTHHSIPLSIMINGKKKYVYFLRNESEEDCISDSRLTLQSIAAIKLLQLNGCESIGFNGARPSSYLPGLPDDSPDMKLRKKLHNEGVYKERVNLILDILYSYNAQKPGIKDIHLISKNDVFINTILKPIVI